MAEYLLLGQTGSTTGQNTTFQFTFTTIATGTPYKVKVYIASSTQQATTTFGFSDTLSLSPTLCQKSFSSSTVNAQVRAYLELDFSNAGCPELQNNTLHYFHTNGGYGSGRIGLIRDQLNGSMSEYAVITATSTDAVSGTVVVQDNGEVIFMLGWIVFFWAVLFFSLIFNRIRG